jgi:hypothetical protein
LTKRTDVEYSRTGELIKGHDKPKVRSRYDEDGECSDPVFPEIRAEYQSCLTTTRQFGVRGTIARAVNGVSLVVIRPVGFLVYHTRPEYTDVVVSGSYCTGQAGLAANSALSTEALLETREEHDRIQAAAEAERAAAKAEELKSGKRKEAVGWSKPQEGEEIELDKARLKKAIDEEKKRKNLSEEELMARAKKSKADVSQEEMGMSSFTCTGVLHEYMTDLSQRRTGCRSRLTTILWQIIRTRRICDAGMKDLVRIRLFQWLYQIHVYQYQYHHSACRFVCSHSASLVAGRTHCLYSA